MEGLTPWDTRRNMEHTQCSVVQLLKLYILNWFKFFFNYNVLFAIAKGKQKGCSLHRDIFRRLAQKKALFNKLICQIWVIFLAETSKDLEMILITTVLSCTNSLSRTSFDCSLKTSFVYSNLFSFAKTVTIR